MIERLRDQYPEVLGSKEKVVKFCPLEKCCIETPERKVVLKKGNIILQSMRKNLEKHLDDLEQRGIIKTVIGPSATR